MDQENTILIKCLKDSNGEYKFETLLQNPQKRLFVLDLMQSLQNVYEKDYKIFMINETIHGQTIEQEYASTERGYEFSLILLRACDMIKTIKINQPKTN